MSLSIEAQSVIRRIIPQIDGHWMQHDDNDGEGNYCLAGFINKEALDDGVAHEVRIALRNKILELESRPDAYPQGAVIISWNDRSGRHESEVKELLRETLATG